MGSSDGIKPGSIYITKAQKWWKARTLKEKSACGAGAGLLALLLLYLIVEDHDNLFVVAEIAHFSGIAILLYKLSQEETCSGISRKSQELTAIFLGIRLYCSFVMEYDVHTLLDLLTFLATGWVLFMMHTKLKKSYTPDLDAVRIEFVLAPCAIMALIAHPATNHWLLNRVLWALCVYLEAVSVLPQLRMMQKAKVVERFTANYVFALGVARFLSCAHWILQIFDGNSFLFTALGSGLWPVMVLVSEIVQTFILGDFCYYYVLSFAQGGSVVRLPSGIV